MRMWSQGFLVHGGSEGHTAKDAPRRTGWIGTLKSIPQSWIGWIGTLKYSSKCNLLLCRALGLACTLRLLRGVLQEAAPRRRSIEEGGTSDCRAAMGAHLELTADRAQSPEA